MAFPNVTDIVATTIENRSGELADNVTNNNPLYAYLKDKGNVRPVSGGSQIFEEIMFAPNGNFSWYSGYDLLNVAAQDVISAAAFPYKQAACPVVINGLEELQNAGKEEIIDMMEGRLKVAEATMVNNMDAAAYSNGTGFGGKQLTGLGAAVVVSPNTGVYGGVDPSLWPFWQNQVFLCGSNPNAGNIQGFMDQAWASTVRGTDRPDVIIFDTNLWAVFLQSLQAIQRITTDKKARLGFPTMQFMDADVVLGSGIGGNAPAWTGYFLNTKYIFLRPHKRRNMVPLSPNRRAPINQDASIEIIAWAGNMTMSGRQFQLFFRGS